MRYGDDLSKYQAQRKRNEIAENLLDWAYELEDLNINKLSLNGKNLDLLALDLHIAAGMLVAARAAQLD